MLIITLAFKTIDFTDRSHSRAHPGPGMLISRQVVIVKLFPMDQLIPAGLLRILLVRTGIEPNLGPSRVCHWSAQRSLEDITPLARRTSSNEWWHLRNCSGLTTYNNWHSITAVQETKLHPRAKVFDSNSKPNSHLFSLTFTCPPFHNHPSLQMRATSHYSQHAQTL